MHDLGIPLRLCQGQTDLVDLHLFLCATNYTDLLSSLLQERLICLTVQSKVDHPFAKMDFINIGDSPIWVKDNRVVDFNPDVTQTRINLEVRDKFLRRRASLRVAASRLYRRDPRVVTVCAEGVLKHWAGLALLLILWLYRIRSKSSKSEGQSLCEPRSF